MTHSPPLDWLCRRARLPIPSCLRTGTCIPLVYLHCRANGAQITGSYCLGWRASAFVLYSPPGERAKDRLLDAALLSECSIRRTAYQSLGVHTQRALTLCAGDIRRPTRFRRRRGCCSGGCSQGERARPPKLPGYLPRVALARPATTPVNDTCERHLAVPCRLWTRSSR